MTGRATDEVWTKWSSDSKWDVGLIECVDELVCVEGEGG